MPNKTTKTNPELDAVVYNKNVVDSLKDKYVSYKKRYKKKKKEKARAKLEEYLINYNDPIILALLEPTLDYVIALVEYKPIKKNDLEKIISKTYTSNTQIDKAITGYVKGVGPNTIKKAPNGFYDILDHWEKNKTNKTFENDFYIFLDGFGIDKRYAKEIYKGLKILEGVRTDFIKDTFAKYTKPSLSKPVTPPVTPTVSKSKPKPSKPAPVTPPVTTKPKTPITPPVKPSTSPVTPPAGTGPIIPATPPPKPVPAASSTNTANTTSLLTPPQTPLGPGVPLPSLVPLVPTPPTKQTQTQQPTQLTPQPHKQPTQKTASAVIPLPPSQPQPLTTPKPTKPTASAAVPTPAQPSKPQPKTTSAQPKLQQPQPAPAPKTPPQTQPKPTPQPKTQVIAVTKSQPKPEEPQMSWWESIRWYYPQVHDYITLNFYEGGESRERMEDLYIKTIQAPQENREKEVRELYAALFEESYDAEANELMHLLLLEYELGPEHFPSPKKTFGFVPDEVLAKVDSLLEDRINDKEKRTRIREWVKSLKNGKKPADFLLK